MQIYALRMWLVCAGIVVTSLVSFAQGQTLVMEVAAEYYAQGSWTALNYNREEFQKFRDCVADRRLNVCQARTNNITRTNDFFPVTSPKPASVDIIADDIKSSTDGIDTFTLLSCHFNENEPIFVACEKKTIDKGTFCVPGDKCQPLTELIHWPDQTILRFAWEKSQVARISRWDYRDIKVSNCCGDKDTIIPDDTTTTWQPPPPPHNFPKSSDDETEQPVERKILPEKPFHQIPRGYERKENDDNPNPTIIGLTIGLILSLLITLSLIAVIVYKKWRAVRRRNAAGKKVTMAATSLVHGGMAPSMDKKQGFDNLDQDASYISLPPSYADLYSEPYNEAGNEGHDVIPEKGGSVGDRDVYGTCV